MAVPAGGTLAALASRHSRGATGPAPTASDGVGVGSQQLGRCASDWCSSLWRLLESCVPHLSVQTICVYVKQGSVSATNGLVLIASCVAQFTELHGLIRSAQDHLPISWPIVLYDLVGDLSEKARKEAASWCGVELRHFELERFGIKLDSRLLTVSMWKPFMIRQCLLGLPPSGIVVYADASTRFQAPLGAPLVDAVHQLGFVGRATAGPVAMYTHPDTVADLAKLGAAVRSDIRDYVAAPMVCGCLNIWSHKALERIIEPWAACAARRECILPRGADGLDNRAGLSKTCRPGLQGHCHRNDQSALSIILFEAFGRHAVNASLSHANSNSSGTTKAAAKELDAAQALVPYLRNTSIGKESFRMGKATLYGTVITTERASRSTADPVVQSQRRCVRSSAEAFISNASAGRRHGWVPCSWSNGCCKRHPRTPSCNAGVFAGVRRSVQ